MDKLRNTFIFGSVSVLISNLLSSSLGGVSSYLTYNLLSNVFTNGKKDKELFQLKRILRQLHHEFIPILKYFSIIASRLYHKAKVEVVYASKGKMKGIITEDRISNNNVVVYRVLNEVEEQVISTYGISKEDYLELLKEYSKEHYVKGIQESTQKLIQTAIEGKTHKLSITVPGSLTLSMHSKIYSRLLAAKRQLAYIRLRHIVIGDEISTDEELAEKIYRLYNVKEIEDKMDRYSFIIRRATYAYKCSESSGAKILEIENTHNELMKLIKENWVIPDMEKEVIEISDSELNARIESQLDYIDKFIHPRKKILD